MLQLILLSADLATMAYVAAQIVRWNRDRWGFSEWLSRMLWGLASAVLWCHVLLAFGFEHHWSHTAAWESTARRTAAAVGWNSGAGLLFNEFLLIWWTVDVLMSWGGSKGSRRDSLLWKKGLEIYLAFMFFNAACVFVPAERRWLGGAAFVVLGVGYLRTYPRNL